MVLTSSFITVKPGRRIDGFAADWPCLRPGFPLARGLTSTWSLPHEALHLPGPRPPPPRGRSPPIGPRRRLSGDLICVYRRDQVIPGHQGRRRRWRPGPRSDGPLSNFDG